MLPGVLLGVVFDTRTDLEKYRQFPTTATIKSYHTNATIQILPYIFYRTNSSRQMLPYKCYHTYSTVQMLLSNATTQMLPYKCNLKNATTNKYKNTTLTSYGQSISSLARFLMVGKL